MGDFWYNLNVKNKIYLTLYNLIFLFIAILLFTLSDFVVHSIRLDWSVPEYYFRNKIIFALIFGVILFFVLVRIKNNVLKAGIFALVICTLLQIRYFLEGYNLSFVVIFWLIHTVILFALAWPLFYLIRKNEEYYKFNLFNMKKLILAVVVLIIVFGVVGYLTVFKQGSEPIVSAPPEAPVSNVVTPLVNSEQGQAAPASEIIVKIKNFTFEPATLNVKKGDTVKWINEDAVPHTVTSDSGNLLNSPTLATGESFTFTFSSPVSENYHCKIHPMMKAKIVAE